MAWQAGGSSSSTADPVSDAESFGQQLADVLLRFPCAALEGVRWTALARALHDRFPSSQALGPPVPASVAAVESALQGVAVLLPQGDDGVAPLLRVLDAAALAPGADGQLACWPLLAQRLGELVRSQGVPQHAAALGPQVAAIMVAEGYSTAAAAAAASGHAEVLGILLAQLKPLLRRYWDPAFEERSIGFYNESGMYVSIKKMKHLVAELLRWRARRRALRLNSGVDAALDAAAPLILAASSRHNDMVLCTPSQAARQLATRGPDRLAGADPCGVYAELPDTGARASDTRAGSAEALEPASLAGASSPASLAAPRGGDSPGAADAAAAPSPCASPGVPQPRPSSAGGVAAPALLPSASASSPCRPLYDPQRVDVLERDCQRLKIENAELKKRLKFGSDFLQKEMRRLRIENAELKKRLYFARCAAGGGQAVPAHGSPFQHLYFSAPTGTQFVAPAVPGVVSSAPACSSPTQSQAAASAATARAFGLPGGAGASPNDTPPHGLPPAAAPTATLPCGGSSGGLPVSGAVSPAGGPGSLTPVAQGFCYAVPITHGQQWPGHIGQLVAMPVYGHDGIPSGSVVSPHSDVSQQMRLLPRSLLSCSEAASSSRQSGDGAEMSPECWAAGHFSGASGPATDVPARYMPSSDDRWVCIPSGIVERQKAQFEDHGPHAEGSSACAAPHGHALAPPPADGAKDGGGAKADPEDVAAGGDEDSFSQGSASKLRSRSL